MHTDDSQPGNVPVDATDRWQLNAPNAFCVIRFVGSFGLVAVALAGNSVVFLVVFLFLAATDWIDGRLASWLNQRTTFGARLDSVADAAMYTALLFGCVWLKGGALAGESAWIAAALACYLLSCAAALLKYRRLPSHHTYTAKFAWLLTAIAAVALFTDWATWPLRIAAVGISLANLESTLITMLSDEWQADVPTVWKVLRRH